MEEIWKPIDGYQGLYEISNHGRVKSIGKRGCSDEGRFISGGWGKYGHQRVLLYCNGPRRRMLVHQLVARAFIGDPPSQSHEVNHIDFDPTNNRVDNLEWVTHQKNILHSRDRLANLKGEDHGSSKLTEQDVVAMRHQYAQGGISFVKLGKKYGICGQQCHRIVRGARWSHI